MTTWADILQNQAEPNVFNLWPQQPLFHADLAVPTVNREILKDSKQLEVLLQKNALWSSFLCDHSRKNGSWTEDVVFWIGGYDSSCLFVTQNLFLSGCLLCVCMCVGCNSNGLRRLHWWAVCLPVRGGAEECVASPYFRFVFIHKLYLFFSFCLIITTITV